MEELKIDDVSKQTGLTKRAIRYYEDLGLISNPKRSEGGVRLYTNEHVTQLNEICELKEVLGFSLQELKQVIAMKRMVDRMREKYESTAELVKMRGELLEVKKALAEQLSLLEFKLHKILRFKGQIEKMMDFVDRTLSRIEIERKR
jgi:DNA-binding transcriptional MerR regulator